MFVCKATNGNDPPAELGFDLDVQGMYSTCMYYIVLSCDKQTFFGKKKKKKQKLYHAGQGKSLKSCCPVGQLISVFSSPH